MSSGAESRHVLVVGGAGYVGSVLVRELLAAGYRVRVLDALIYGNGAALSAVGDREEFSFLCGDVRFAPDIEAALEGITDVVLLAALVGDPVCKRNPGLAREVNLDGARLVVEAASRAGADRFVFASTCSNYGLRDTEDPATEADELKPLSLYAETKVAMEEQLLDPPDPLELAPTVLRVATAYGLSARMRFDLTVSEFTRDLALGRRLEVYDADTWRPYCHVRDISAAIALTLEAPADRVAGEVFNVGGDESNHTKRSIVEAVLETVADPGEVVWTEGGVDARNYRVSFDKIKERLGFAPSETVPGSVTRLARMVRAGVFEDVEDRPNYYGNQAFVAPAAAGEGTGGGDAG